MMEAHRIWIDQCEAARQIQEDFGTEKALGYLVGEKLVNFVREADSDPDFAADLPAFLFEVRKIFDAHDLQEYLENPGALGALGHVASKDVIAMFRREGVVEHDMVSEAEEVITVARLKEMLLG